MNQTTANPISVNDGEITIDAALLAHKLGLSPEALRAEMRRGAVLSVVEKGQDEDAGRTRLTFRHGAQTWRIVIEPSGRRVDVPSPVRRRAPTLFDLARRASWD